MLITIITIRDFKKVKEEQAIILELQTEDLALIKVIADLLKILIYGNQLLLYKGNKVSQLTEYQKMYLKVNHIILKINQG
jgi:hypothetical protein